MSTDYDSITADKAREIASQAPTLLEKILDRIVEAAGKGRSELDWLHFPRPVGVKLKVQLEERGFKVFDQLERTDSPNSTLVISWE